MIAALPMYDRSETAGALDRFWAGIRDALHAGGLAAPEALSRDIGLWDGWEHPGLVLGQTCGLPYRARLAGRVTLIAAGDYALEDTPPGYYRSLFVVRARDGRTRLADYADARLAYSDAMSQSGWAAPQHAAAEAGFAFHNLLPTGAHRLSAHAVARSQADIAAIDAVSWRAITDWEGLDGQLRIIERSAPTPGLPYIAAPGAEVAATRRALEAGLDALSDTVRATLGLVGIVPMAPEDYLSLPIPPEPGA